MTFLIGDPPDLPSRSGSSCKKMDAFLVSKVFFKMSKNQDGGAEISIVFVNHAKESDILLKVKAIDSTP